METTPYKRALIIVVSDAVYQGLRRDETGALYKKLLQERGWRVEGPLTIPNKTEDLTRLLLDHTCQPHLILVLGGTGPSPRDVSADVAQGLSWRSYPGFGEEFRRRSLSQAGVRSLGSRAGLYQVGKALVAVLPGSQGAAEVAVPLLDEMAPHLLEEYQRPPSRPHGSGSVPGG